ncbi:galactosyltransferase-related protein [Atlantibacter hermannii]|uniref:Glycosyltransferase 2-like prokaryotic type domain-containing protein n=2 Tax=Atlantibacter hermannii TaxID=565 RepID=H5UZP4_ATLHE|nr:galactosyltransferase-related protein [Atlantibacter hermannii]QPS92374.1 capsular biosynthesis protein [Atlantibacter hermannii]GAB51202.1 hypothetical protein EH105704_02_02310 [Atlantibacter hermannii NBRC 105704]VDZ75112.1 putative Capsule biosynthesis protein [Atlantibacter hermannii]
MNDSLNDLLTILIPIDLRYRKKDILEKAKKFAFEANKHNIKLIFGVSADDTSKKIFFTEVMRNYANVEILFSQKISINVNTSLLRNLAFTNCKTKYIALFDVDIFPDMALIIKYLQLISSKKKPFYIIPCLYLTSFGSLALMEGKITINELKEKYFAYSRKEFLHLASPSSLTIMSAKDYAAIHGFDTCFEGHGYEDFDFLIRLCEYHGLLNDTYDLLVENTSRSPLFYVGYRKHLGKLCFDSLLEKDIAFHIFHQKNDINDYHLMREKNRLLFQKKHRGFYKKDNISARDNDYSLIDFIEHCKKNNYDLRNYSILFEDKPGHIDRYDTFRKKIKFLFNE